MGMCRFDARVRSLLAAFVLTFVSAACSGGGGSSPSLPVANGPAPVGGSLPATAGSTAPTVAPTSAPTAASTSASSAVQTKSGAAVPPSQTQPFANSPFDRPVLLPQLDPNSATYLTSTLGGDYAHFGKLQFATNVTGPTDSNVPVYVAHSTDPVYTIHCAYYTNCPLEGQREHIPAGAVPGGRLGYTTFTDDGTHDQHMAVRDLDAQVEYDTWLTPQPSGTGGTLVVGYGGAFPLSGGGVGQSGGATAAGFALSQGRIRAVDLLAGRIPYALFLVTPCENGHVAPATGDDGGHTAGCPPLGAHVWLDSTPVEVAASGAAPDFRIVLDALHEFGGYIGDRCGSCTLGVALEGGAAYAAFDQPDPWTQVAAHFPNETPSGAANEYHIPISTGSIDLSKHLHVISN